MSQLTLVLGGASSGKSSFAESLVFASKLPRVYIATAQAFDAEMDEKIAAHKVDRGPDWLTIEAPHDVSDALTQVSAGQMVLVDCASMWLSNRLLSDADPMVELPAFIDAMRRCASPVVVVSNEVGMGIVPENALARRFRIAQGGVNARIAQAADRVFGVMAGLPFALKGTLPEGPR